MEVVLNTEVEINDPGTPAKDEEEPPKKTNILSRIMQWTPPLWLDKVVVSTAIPLLVWAVTFLLVGHDCLPGGQTFALVVIIFFGIATGFALELINFPPLLGMLAVGMALRNVPAIQFGKDLTNEVSSPLRQMALVVILIRAGLGLDPVALKKLSTVVLRLAFGPCLMEALTLAVASNLVLGFPWAWGFLLGFVIAAVSPAVIVPCLLNLRDKGYGVEKGIPTIVIAAASVDDILAISAFGVTLGFALTNPEESLTQTIIQGPIELVLGITFGILWGMGIGIFVGHTDEEVKGSTIFRLIFCFAGGCLSVFGFQYIKFPGSGALGCLLSAFIAAVIWRQKGCLKDNDTLNWIFQILWFVFQPLLFGLIGAEIDLINLDTNIVLLGVITLCIGLVIRILTSFMMVACAGLSIKERIFVALAWLPKATVQAAIGPVAYDLARSQSAGKDAEKLGMEVLTIAVISILLTAPIGAIAIMISGPKLLSKGAKESDSDNDGTAEDQKTLTTLGTEAEPTSDRLELVIEENERGLVASLGRGDYKVTLTDSPKMIKSS